MRFALATLGLLTALYYLPGRCQGQCGTVYRAPSYSYSTPSYSYSAPTYSTHSKVVYPAVVNYETKVKEVVVPVLQPFPFFIDPRISYVYNSGTYVGVPLVPGPPTNVVGHAGGGHMMGHTAVGGSGAMGHPPAASPAVTPAPASRVHAAPSGGYAKPAYSAPSTPPPLDVDALIERIEARVRERMGTGGGGVVEESGPPPVPGFTPSPPPATYLPPSYPPSHAGSATGYPPAGYAPTARTMSSVLQGRCGRCHTGEGSKGDFQIFTSRGVLSPSFDYTTVMDAINEGRMPPSPGAPLSEEERRIVASGR